MPQREVATLAGGCFWCLEAAFQQLQGVEQVRSGYAGGHVANPSYEDVCTGTTGHAEVVQITFVPDVLCLELPDDLLRHGLLLRGVVEDGRAVLGAHVPALAVERGRIVNREKDVEQVVERHDGGVEGDLHDLGVARGAGADVLVRRVRHAPPGVARLNLLDTLQVLEGGFQTPEAPAGEGCHFALRHPHIPFPRSYESYPERQGVITPAAPGRPARCRPRAPGSWRMPSRGRWRCRR